KIYAGSSTPIRLRGHTLLCLQGFRGEGYSPSFVANMAAIHQTLCNQPEATVQVVASPDAVCAACPHQQGSSGCTLNGEPSEADMVDQDRVVLGRLGLKAGDHLSWQEVLGKIITSMSGDDLPSICGSCRWLPLGYCREGIDRLRSSIRK
ncbi:MAG: DUF1284 domain-containing protein, partial [Nitrospira sp. LK70]|nr:DUF1284 domain-containing protein [Nitrospira sp. LK70]